MKSQIQKATEKAARQDLKIAKTSGVVVVTGTKIGNVQIKFCFGALFRFENFNTGEPINWNSSGKTHREAVQFLSSLYVVEAA